MIGEWKFEDYDGAFRLSVTGPKDMDIVVDDDGDLCVSHYVRDYSYFSGDMEVHAYVPLEVVAELLRLHGYDVIKR